MSTKNPQFPLEDDLSAVTEIDSGGFYHTKGVSNGVLIKAPFDGVVKSLIPIPESEDAQSTADFLLANSVKHGYRWTLAAEDGSEFYVFGMLPNDKAKNVGASFKSGENIGRVALNIPENFSYKYSLAEPTYNADGVQIAPSEEIKSGEQKKEAEEKEAKEAPTTFFKKLGWFAAIASSLVVLSFVYKNIEK